MIRRCMERKKTDHIIEKVSEIGVEESGRSKNNWVDVIWGRYEIMWS